MKGPVEHYLLRRRLREKQQVQAFASLIASPFNLGSAVAGDPLPNSFPLPHSRRLAVSASQATQQGDLLVTVGLRTMTIPGGIADTIFRLDHAERDRTVSVSSNNGCPACTVTLYVLDERLKPFAIATGTVT